MKNLIYNLDILNNSPQIYFEGKLRASNALGVLISIVIGVAMLILGIFFLKQSTDRKLFFMTSSDIYTGSAPYILKNFSFVFDIRDGKGKPFEDFQKYFTINVISAEKRQMFKYCSLKDRGLEYEPGEDERLTGDKLFCFQDDFVFNTTRYGGGSWISIVISSCYNETEDQIALGPSSDMKPESLRRNGCYSTEKIKDRLNFKETYFFLKMIDHSVNHSSVDNIFPSFKNQLFLRVSPDIQLRYLLKFQPIIYNLDMGYIFEEIKTYESFIFTNYDMQVSAVNPNSLTHKISQIDINLDPYMKIYNRSYVKLQQASANIGGIGKFLLIAGQIVMYIYANNYYFLSLANNILFYYKGTSEQESNQSLPLIQYLQEKNNQNLILNPLNSSSQVNKFNNVNNIVFPTTNEFSKINKYGVFFTKPSKKTNDNLNNTQTLIKKGFASLNNDDNKMQLSIIRLMFCPTKKFKETKKLILNNLMSIENVLKTMIELVHLKDFIVQDQNLYYFGYQKILIDENRYDKLPISLTNKNFDNESKDNESHNHNAYDEVSRNNFIANKILKKASKI